MPTPCRPPETAYPLPPNLPPACSTVRTTSTAGRPSAGDDVDRDAAAVVDHAHAAVGQQRDLDVVAVAGQGLVDGVVDDLVHQVVQAALAGGADVHAGALADGLETLEHRDRAGVVAAVAVGVVGSATAPASGCSVGSRSVRSGCSARAAHARRSGCWPDCHVGHGGRLPAIAVAGRISDMADRSRQGDRDPSSYVLRWSGPRPGGPPCPVSAHGPVDGSRTSPAVSGHRTCSRRQPGRRARRQP